MSLADPKPVALGVAMLFVSASIAGLTDHTIEASQQAVRQVPVVSTDPKIQGTIEAQLAAASLRFDPTARVSLNLTATPLREILDGVAKAGGLTVRYASQITGLDTPASVALSERPVEEALHSVLKNHALAFLATGSKAAFIYADTPANRDKYTASIRVFPIAKADIVMMTQQLNRALKPTDDGLRATVVTVRDSRTLIVRAVPELMTSIATWIAENDKDPSHRN